MQCWFSTNIFQIKWNKQQIFLTRKGQESLCWVRLDAKLSLTVRGSEGACKSPRPAVCLMPASPLLCPHQMSSCLSSHSPGAGELHAWGGPFYHCNELIGKPDLRWAEICFRNFGSLVLIFSHKVTQKSDLLCTWLVLQYFVHDTVIPHIYTIIYLILFFQLIVT